MWRGGEGEGGNVRNVQSMICKALSERFQTVKMPNWVMCPNMEGWDGGNQTYGHFQNNLEFV